MVRVDFVCPSELGESFGEYVLEKSIAVQVEELLVCEKKIIQIERVFK